MNRLRSQRGQSMVEYGLLLILSIMVATYVFQTHDTTKSLLEHSTQKTIAQNPQNIMVPKVPTREEAWDNRVINHTPDYKYKPVAFFSVTNPIYVGETVTYWDGSYDPDGTIVKREWQGNQSSFGAPGKYKVSLTVTDNDGNSSTYSLNIEVTEKQTYTRIVYDHENATKTEKGRSVIRNVGSANTLIIDHVFGKRKDLYNVEHVVIEQNLFKTTQLREQTIYYDVLIPVYEVTYSGDGREISRQPYYVDGQPYSVYQTDEKIVPQPAKITTELKDNTWTFYVYENISSVNNSNTSYTARSAGADYSRFAPDTEINSMPVKVRQDPQFISSRDSQKLNQKNAGYTSPTTPCPTCTEPNRYNAQSTEQSDYRGVTCSGNGLSISTTNLTHKRTYNWINHSTYDHIFKYTGMGKSQGNASAGSEVKIQRNTWKTEGWQGEELAGTPDSGTQSTGTTRPKYTDCDGSGWSESCWRPVSSSSSTNSACERYGSTTRSQSTGCQYGPSTTSAQYDLYRQRVLNCTWNGTSLSSASPSYANCGDVLVRVDPYTCNPPPPPPTTTPTNPTVPGVVVPTRP